MHKQYVGGELEKCDDKQRDTMALNVECFEARLDVVENRVDRFGESIEMIQKEVVPKLKESVLEELLVQINVKKAKRQHSEILKWEGQKAAKEEVESK